MRKIFTVLSLSVITLGTVFTSCSSSDNRDEQASTRYNVIGTWDLMAFKDENGKFIDATILKQWAAFNADGTYKSYSNKSNYSGTYTYDNKSLITASVSGFKVYYNIISIDGNEAIAEYYDQSNTNDRVTFKLKRR
ncbi:hypothetical protein CMV03_07010 [Elizabethkingia anophelis]|nr:hypothetical protein [Elizabethkingia anophelis]